jgi:hypothetical protein
LSKEADIVAAAPVLDQKPSLQADDMDLCLTDMLPGRLQSQEGSLVRAMVPLHDCHAIASGKDVLDVVPVVRERREEHA